MTRSGSNFSLSLGGLGLTSRRGPDEPPAKTAEVTRAERLRDCDVQVSEVSAKDDVGIEALFLQITHRLVERKADIESARVLRSRDSVLLTEPEVPTAAGGVWCC